MKTIDNKKKMFVLGESGTLVKCMLLDSMEDIKAANPKLSDDELAKTYEVLQAEIDTIKTEQENEHPTEN